MSLECGGNPDCVGHSGYSDSEIPSKNIKCTKHYAMQLEPKLLTKFIKVKIRFVVVKLVVHGVTGNVVTIWKQDQQKDKCIHLFLILLRHYMK